MPLLFEDKPIPQTLRTYQCDAINAVQKAWENDDNAPLVAVATGGGKTTILAQLLVDTLDPRTQRALVVAHTEEIIFQLYERIRNQFSGTLDSHFGDAAVPGIGIVMAERDGANARIVVATRQSLHTKRLAALLKHGAIDTLVIDEAHHAQGDNSYGQMIKTLRAANPALKIVGLTATPSRGDRRALATIFSSIAYEWLIPDGISGGYLVPVQRIRVSTHINLSGVKTTAGDYQTPALISALETANWLDLCASAYQSHIVKSGRSCLAFFPSVEMSRQFAAKLNEMGVPAAHIDATTPKDERRTHLRAYQDGTLKAISNMGVLTEGFDAPSTGAIFLARPTRSRTLFTQIVGRGLRPFPGKHDCLLVDMTVEDTRALETGTLLGRMVKCAACATEYYAGLKRCPACGHERTESKHIADDGMMMRNLPSQVGDGLIVNYDALFEQAFAAWHHGDDGFLSCTITFEDGALIIVPPLEDNYYRLARVPKDYEQSVQFIQRNEDLAALMLDAERVVQERGSKTADKDAPWRKEPVTQAQLGILQKLGVKADPTLSKGAASQLITHAIAVKRLISATTR